MKKKQEKIRILQQIKQNKVIFYNGKAKTVKRIWFDYKGDCLISRIRVANGLTMTFPKWTFKYLSEPYPSWQNIEDYAIKIQFMENPSRVYTIAKDTSLSLLPNKEEMRSKSIDTKKIAFEIIDIFEERLNSLNLYLPDRMREGDGDEPTSDDEASIFGETYYEFEEAIIDILKRNMED